MYKDPAAVSLGKRGGKASSEKRSLEEQRRRAKHMNEILRKRRLAKQQENLASIDPIAS